MILKSIFLLLAIAFFSDVSAEFGSIRLDECQKPNEPVYGGDSCQVCICTHDLQVNCTIRPSCLSSNADDVPLLKNSNNVVLTKDTKDTKVKAENVTPASTRPPCKLDKVFRKYCNTCKCFANGVEGCTQKFCSRSIYNLDGTLVKSKSFTEKFDSFGNINIHDFKDNKYFSYDHPGANDKDLNIIPISGGKIGNPNIDLTKIDPLSIQPTMDEVDNY